jgi:hypothetical protein
MLGKYINTFRCKTLQNLPESGFLSENIPSGNPDSELKVDGETFFCFLQKTDFVH